MGGQITELLRFKKIFRAASLCCFYGSEDGSEHQGSALFLGPRPHGLSWGQGGNFRAYTGELGLQPAQQGLRDAEDSKKKFLRGWIGKTCPALNMQVLFPPHWSVFAVQATCWDGWLIEV